MFNGLDFANWIREQWPFPIFRPVRPPGKKMDGDVSWAWCVVFLIGASLLTAASFNTIAADELKQADKSAQVVDYETQIRPLLQRRCLDCHGDETQESRFRVDRRTALLRGGDSGEPAILPGNSRDSHLMKLVQRTSPTEKMPPDDDDRLTEDEITLLKNWIDQGAKWTPGSAGDDADTEAVSDHWSFQPLSEISPPPDQPQLSNQNPIDAFVGRQRKRHGLAASPQAERSVLIRRLWLDVLGLPPGPDEVAAFSADNAPDAWSKLVESALASPHYGERWASHWLDLVRFSETNGFETNRERPNAWPFRDYVIRSLNEDKPYDVFLKEQIAGDAMGVPVATGYLVAGPYDLVKSPDVNLTLMQRANELDDMINTTGTAFLGLTLGCARCHNHKFDPIRQTDYYAVQAIFAGVQHGERAVPPDADQTRQLTELDGQIAELRKTLKPLLTGASDKRPPVNAMRNEERLAPIAAKSLRFSIRRTNSSQPCIDELEVFAGDDNVALASAGTIPACSSSLPGYEIHKLEHINDGQFGNGYSWISNEPGGGWVQLNFPEVVTIDRIIWGRDREGKFGDRLAIEYKIEVAVESDEWKTVASSEDRLPFGDAKAAKPNYQLENVADSERPKFAKHIEQLTSLEKARDQIARSSTVYAGTFNPPPVTHRLFRGEPALPREIVAPNTVEVLGRLPLTESSGDQQRRVALAEWIASPQNPLTARVIVNRIWQFHFGRGLIATPSDFGAAGVAPSHPELLDWLALELIRHQWSLKHIHRLILQSAAYQQSSQPDDDSMRIDADNQWLWRFTPRRLEAEAVRDSILSVTGVLDTRMGGPGFSAFEIELENVRHYFPKKKYGPDDWRRMVYMTRVRLERDSVFGVFDCPDGASSVPKRTRSTTPLQALNLFNSEFMLQQADLFAERLERYAGGDSSAQVRHAFLLCFSRFPDADELDSSQQFIASEGLPAFCRAMLNSNEFLFVP